jgi:DNA-binding CsgD family transcriptional regulator
LTRPSPRRASRTPEAREEAAACLLGRGDEAGRELLAEAVAGYERLGARWDLDRVLHLAREHGLSRHARHRGGRQGYGSELSPRERQVAELVAIGRTNKEIAAQLFISVRTADGHLGTVLRKLGLRSRTELAHRLTSEHGKNR